MIDLKNLNRAIEQIVKEKGIDAALVLGAVESAIAAAYRKEYGKKGEIIKAKIDTKAGKLNFWQIKTVVDESTVRFVEDDEPQDNVELNPSASLPSAKFVTGGASAERRGRRVKKEEGLDRGEADGDELAPLYNSDRHILIEEAKKIKNDAALGDELEFELPEHEDFGRIASQAAKQVILQRLREVERESVDREYKGKEGEVVSGIVQRAERGNVYIDLGRAAGIMFYNESIPGEHYRVGERLRFYLLAVQEESRMPGVILSRSHPRFVSKLFELEVPEIQEGLVEIKAIAREPGSRTKIAVFSNAEGVDPVGALVGQRGTRVMAVTNELGNEKIDIIEWSDDPVKFIGSSLSPAKIRTVEALPRRTALVLVPEDQLSLAIGRGGQNARLAAKLTGWKIDVRSASRPDVAQEGGITAEDSDSESENKEGSDSESEGSGEGVKENPSAEG